MKKLLLLICLILLPCVSLAAPVISSYSDGTITGTGFGVNATATPLVFEDFDTNDAGRQDGDVLQAKNCSDYGAWEDSFVDTKPTYSNLNNRQNSVLAGYYPLVANDVAANHAPGTIEFSSSHEPTVLLSLWFRYTFDSYDSSTGNVKIYRITDGVSNEDTHIIFNNGAGNNDPTNGGGIIGVEGTFKIWPIEGDTTLNFTYLNDGAWEHHLIMLKASDDGVANGSAKIYIRGQKLEDTTVMETWGTGEEWKSFTMGWYVANYTAGNFNIYADDIYIDDSWQSVFLCNTSNFTTSSVKEIQVQTSRSDTSIDIDFNKRSFSTNDTAYLFVVDSDGAVSNGYEITVGATAPTSEGQPTTIGAGQTVNFGVGQTVNIK